MRNKDPPPAADRFTKQVVFDVLPLVPEVLQLPCQCHLGLGKPLTLFVLDMLFHREAHNERTSRCPCEYTPYSVSIRPQKRLKTYYECM
jgi:hypothetical protein